MSGCILMSPLMNIVIVEGGPKGMRKFKKLMLRRIDWNAPITSKNKDGDMMDETTDEQFDKSKDEENENSNNQTKKCLLVWEGTVLRSNFKTFRVEQAGTEAIAKKILKEHGVEHYWDLARNFKVDSLLTVHQIP